LGALRDVLVIAGHELAEALRSKRVLLFALLYVGGAIGGTVLFIEFLSGMEAMLADTLMVARSSQPGAFTRALMSSEQAQRFLSRMLDDEALAAQLVTVPPLSLFYGWLVLSFCPALVMLTAPEAVTQDLSTGAVRFSLVRTSRLSYSVGKLVGQAALLGVSVLAGALGVWLVGHFRFVGFVPLENALWLLGWSGRGFVYCLAYVGLALGLSHATRSVPVSRVLGLLALALLAALWGLSRTDWVTEHAAPLARTLSQLLPAAHERSLWHPALGDRLPAMVMLVALGISYFALGYRFRSRRDT
jgi:hypothetical protein